MPSMHRLSALSALAFALLAVAPAAHARVVVVASGDAAATLTDVTTNKVAARIAVGGRTRAAAVAPDGTRAYVATGRRVVAIDLGTRAVVGTAVARGTVTALAASSDGQRVYAARPGALEVIDAPTMTARSAIALGRRSHPSSLAVADDGTLAAVALDSKHAALADLVRFHLRKRIAIADPGGVAFRPGSRQAWVSSARGRLYRFGPDGRLLGRWSLGRSVGGGGLAWTIDGRHAIAGGNARATVTAVFSPARRRVTSRVHTGRGPGFPAVSPDGTRAYVADRGSGTVSVLSALSFRRLAVQRLPRTARPGAIAVQPGVALIVGTDGNDVLKGTRGMDRIDARAGDDQASGGRANDTVLGGPGNDYLTGGSSDDVLDGGEGDDRLFGSTGNDQVLGGLGNDYGNGGTGNDKVDGGDGNDSLDGGDGDDTVLGGPGDDRIKEAGLGNDFLLDGGPGNDFVDGNRGSDKIKGSEGNDTLFGGPGSELIDGGVGDDSIDGGTGGDRLYGREGNDTIKGDAGRDTLYGSYGNDTLDGGSSDDYLSGSYGSDEIIGGPGGDDIFAGTGNDEIRSADDSADHVDCGPGRDTVYVESTAPARDFLNNCETVVRVPPEPATDAPSSASNIFGTPGNDLLLGTPGNDSLFGSDGDDSLFGQDGNDYVDGENGNDTLRGGHGDDEIHGRNDDDLILGGPGNDAITGDRGDDTINGEDGDDSINGNLDDDVIEGGPGNDHINAVGGGADRVSCGDGADVVFADVGDQVNANCEDVRR
jgi:Ca2+-binding RTX toxin-like protein